MTFGIEKTRNADDEPSDGPADDCGDDNSLTFCFENPVVGTATWTRTLGPLNLPIVSIAFSPTQLRQVFALDERGAVRVKDDIEDDAPNWRIVGDFVVRPDDFALQIVPDIANAAILYAISHRQFLISTDGGASWTPRLTSTAPAPKFNSICTHPDKPAVLFLSTDSDVLTSNDRGTTWASIGATLPNAPVMQVFTHDGFLYAVTFGRGLWRGKL